MRYFTPLFMEEAQRFLAQLDHSSRKKVLYDIELATQSSTKNQMKPTESQPLRTLDEMKDEFVGIRGTAEREAYEHALRMEVIGNQIRALRKKRGMTQGDLGLLLGVQKAQISKLENGTHSATIDTILRAFRALNAEVLFQVRDLE